MQVRIRELRVCFGALLMAAACSSSPTTQQSPGSQSFAAGTGSVPPPTAGTQAGTAAPATAGTSGGITPITRPVSGSGAVSGMTGGTAGVGAGASAGTGVMAGAGADDSDAGVMDGSGGSAGGSGMPAAGSGGAAGGGAAGGGSTAMAGACTSLPAVTDYGAKGPFSDAKMFANTGPSNNYTIYRPDASLGKDGFKHPIATWGNGIATTPDQYKKLLNLVASHGFVIIGCNDTQAERACLNSGMEWLVAQNTATGPFQGKLDTSRELAIGYSWGGGAAIDVSDRPNIKATISLHGMPPRVSDAFDKMHSPLLLTTSTGDNFVTPSGYVTPNYDKAKVQTFYGTLSKLDVGHLSIVDKGAAICIGELIAGTFGNCNDAADEQALTVAWLRWWACDDQAAAKFFVGDDCELCKSPWTKPQRKNWP